jgi:hypothetical protein
LSLFPQEQMAIACGSRAHLEKESIAQVRLSRAIDNNLLTSDKKWVPMFSLRNELPFNLIGVFYERLAHFRVGFFKCA